MLHYQSPFNAEIYVHRAGRTARIGRSGESLALLAPEDERNFKNICKVLSKDMEKVQMLDVKYAHLELMKPVVNTAVELEKKAHREGADEKAANWLLKTAREADLALDEDLKAEVQEKLAGKKRQRSQQEDSDGGDDIDKPMFKQFDDGGERKRLKTEQRAQALKQHYEKEKQEKSRYKEILRRTGEDVVNVKA